MSTPPDRDGHAGLVRRMRRQADSCRDAGSPLTADLLDGAADDLAAGGPAAALLGQLAHDPPGSVPPLRLAGALHRLVLERRAPALALHYPSVGGTPGRVWPAARDVVEDQLDVLRELVARPVQTNEVGRSAVLLGGLLHLARETSLPARLLELGASGGLNLLVDRYGYEVADGVVLGDPDSPVRLTRPWHGAHPPYAALDLVERVGCDPHPLDPTSTDDRLTLTSYVWADQVERFERLRAALAVAAPHPVVVERLPASELLARELAEPRTGVVTVVWQSVVQQYLSPAERARVAELLAEAGARASSRAPLAHLAMEPVRFSTGGSHFAVTLTTWPGGAVRELGKAQGHGPPVVWR